MFQAGDKVAEHLELVRLLGAGGMGSVWVAKHLRLRTEVAVKFLSASMLNNSAARSRFDREAQWVAQVKSPHVVQVLDQGVTTLDPPQPYIVMELLEGEDLGRLLDRLGPLPLADALYILDQTCSGLAAAHSAGLVHRDIKPENIFLMTGERPFVKILDFGVARATQDTSINRLTHTGGVIGTAHYMSPEQLFEGKQVDHRTDIWALGVVTYRMVTGQLPFDGNTYGDLCLAVNQGKYTPPSRIGSLPSELDGLIAHALATDRNQRFSSVREFSAELRALAQRISAVPALPPLAGSSAGVVPAITAPGRAPGSAGSGSHPGADVDTGSGPNQTEAGATITVESVPLRRSGLLAAGAVAAVIALGAAGFGVFQFLSRGAPLAGQAEAASSPVQAGTPPSHAPPAAKAAASAAETGPTASPVASDTPSDFAGESTPRETDSRKKMAKSAAQPPRKNTAPRTSTPQPTSTRNDQASGPKPAKKTSPNPTSTEKYRGF